MAFPTAGLLSRQVIATRECLSPLSPIDAIVAATIEISGLIIECDAHTGFPALYFLTRFGILTCHRRMDRLDRLRRVSWPSRQTLNLQSILVSVDYRTKPSVCILVNNNNFAPCVAKLIDDGYKEAIEFLSAPACTYDERKQEVRRSVFGNRLQQACRPRQIPRS
jgi:hypothetical protein